ncbi:glutamate receptor 2.8-like [Hibiscus syriacus]|uniref:Glutamate receptor 2.8-like n=1 Tax=Hibiscus syriacus TaxID=106335 RepID=A0A6A2XC02_HIBSY|nr:glutamate receptor 2.8-like [Hibiscus syriacus]
MKPALHPILYYRRAPCKRRAGFGIRGSFDAEQDSDHHRRQRSLCGAKCRSRDDHAGHLLGELLAWRRYEAIARSSAPRHRGSAAHERVLFKRLHCDGRCGFRGGEGFHVARFIKMMWRRTLFLLDVLKRGYSFVFTDTDVMWLRNPFTKRGLNGTEDLQISIDMFYGDPRPDHNLINTGAGCVVRPAATQRRHRVGSPSKVLGDEAFQWFL